MLKVVIVGCGKIADDHAAAIQRIGGSEIVGVCDREPLMAEQLAERFHIKRWSTDLSELVRDMRPDVVHITTPPASHFELARLCLERGVHVYVEKPFTLFESEARELVTLAEERQLQITVGHDAQFGHASRRMRSLINGGYLGGAPLHMESYYGYELGQAYARALLSEKAHWVRQLPGQLLQNIISHGIARIAEYLPTASPEVAAHGFTSPFLRQMGEVQIVDELRVIISDGDRTTAYFTFSSQMRPAIHEFRVFGAQNGLVLDPDRETLVKLAGTRYTSYADKFLPPVGFAGQYLGNFVTNARTFLARDFHMKSGMKYLIEALYRSIADGTQPPIPHREMVLTARIMDAIFAQVHAQAPSAEQDGVPALHR